MKQEKVGITLQPQEQAAALRNASTVSLVKILVDRAAWASLTAAGGRARLILDFEMEGCPGGAAMEGGETACPIGY